MKKRSMLKLLVSLLCLQSITIFASSLSIEKKEINLNLIWISMPHSSKGLSELPGPRDGYDYEGDYHYTEVPKFWLFLNQDIPITVSIHWCALNEDDRDKIEKIYLDLESEYTKDGFNIKFIEFNIESDPFFQNMIYAGAHAGALSDYLRLKIFVEKYLAGSLINKTYVYADFDIEPFCFSNLLLPDRTSTKFPLDSFVSYLGENSFLSIPGESPYFETLSRYFEIDREIFIKTFDEDRERICELFEPLESIFYTAIRECTFSSELPEGFKMVNADDLNIISLDHESWK